MDLWAQGAFVLRTPALPFAAWAGLDGDAGRAGDLLGTPAGRDALAVASPDTLAALDRGDAGAGDALLRYAARMAARPTPFGLFAGWSTGGAGEEARLTVGAGRPHSRLDAHVLLELVARQAADPAVRRALTFRPNAGLYRAGGRLRYVETAYADGAAHPRLVAVTEDAHLQAVLAAASGGASWPALVDALAALGVGDADAEAYLGALADAQVLCGDLALQVTGPEPTRPIARRLRAAGATAAADALDAAADRLADADAAPPGGRAQAHADVAELLVPLGVDAPPGRLVQVDLSREAPGLTLPVAALEDLRRAVELLRRLSPPAADELAAFRARFAARYETRPVPLAEALDPEGGIGFELGATPVDEPPADPRTKLLLDLLLEATATGAAEVELDPRRLAGLPAAPLPGAFAVLAVPGPRGDVRPLSVSGPSGATLLGRFCHADPALEAAVRAHLAEEQAREPEGTVLAEIVHLPEGRMGNVLLRPDLREHRIVLDAAGAGGAGTLALDDLTLALEDGVLVLRSARLGRRVLPRLTSAHNHRAHGIGLYRFLAALAGQDVRSWLAWDWRELASAPRTPRVRCGRVVLDVARWRVPDDLGDVDAWRRAHGVPQIIAIAGPDAPLPLDLGTAHGVRELRRLRPPAVAEWWPDPDELPVTDAAGARYAAEIVVPFTRPPDPAPAAAPRTPRPVAQRTFPPGSEWLYAKLYAAGALHDGLITGGLGPLARDALAAGEAEAWHVLRHADPEEHLRVRFRGDPDGLRARVLPRLERLAGAAIADGRAWRLVLDTYEREVERYGDVEAAEAVFAADSERVLALLEAQPPGADAADDRWVTAAGSVLALVLDLGVPEAGAGALLEACRGPLDAPRRRALAALQRRHRAALEQSVAAALDGPRAPLPPVPGTALPALVHLHLNRLLRVPAHEQEVAACDAAARTLASLRARVPTRLRDGGAGVR